MELDGELSESDEASKMKPSGEEGPQQGVFIAARNIKNDGVISGPRVDVVTENYSGQGKVSAFEENLVDVWYKSWWMLYLVYPLIVLLVGTSLLYYLFGIGKSESLAPTTISNSYLIQTTNQSGGTNIINPAAEIKLDYYADKANVPTTTGYASDFTLTYFSSQTINRSDERLFINELLKCQEPLEGRSSDNVGGKYDGMKTREYKITCISSKPLPTDNTVLFKFSNG